VPAQPRHRSRVTIERAFEVAQPALDVWLTTRRHPEQPPFSGGVLDWPQWLRQALEVMDVEQAVVEAVVAGEERQRG
jgi:hypothetical protein